MVRTQVQLTEEQASLVKRIAADRHVSMAMIIREALEAMCTLQQDVYPATVRDHAQLRHWRRIRL